MRLLTAPILLISLMLGHTKPNASNLNFNAEPKTYYDTSTGIKTFSWQHTARFMSPDMPVFALHACAKPQELVAPLVTLYFYRNKLAFAECKSIEWRINGQQVEPLGQDYTAHFQQASLNTETFRFAFAWEDLVKLSGSSAAIVRICNEHIPILHKEKAALLAMLNVLVKHSTDLNPEHTGTVGAADN